MNSERRGVERKDPPATIAGDPDRELELTLKRHPENKQAQVDVGSDGSMDASDPPSACQPGGNDPVPSNDFPESALGWEERPQKAATPEQPGPAKKVGDDTANPLPDDLRGRGSSDGSDAG